MNLAAFEKRPPEACNFQGLARATDLRGLPDHAAKKGDGIIIEGHSSTAQSRTRQVDTDFIRDTTGPLQKAIIAGQHEVVVGSALCADDLILLCP
jgi:hypothetical protein